MDRHERLSALLDMVGQRSRIEVESTAVELSVSPATIRRDLDHLAGRQLLTRTRGGAVPSNVAYDLPLRHRSARLAPEKQRISAAAAGLVRRGTVVGMGGGTTITEVARAVGMRPDLNEESDEPVLTVVTNALNIAGELAVRRTIKIVVTGGVARHTFELTGPLAGLLLDEITIDLLFLGADAVHPEHGARSHREDEAGVAKLMAERAQQVAVVAEGSKLGGQAFAQSCPVERIDLLITDSGAEPARLREFDDAGVRTHIV